MIRIGQAAGHRGVAPFRFAVLIVVGIIAQIAEGNVKIMLIFRVGGHAVGVQIAEIEIPALLVSVPVSASAERRIGKQLAEGGNVELGPVVRALVTRRNI